MDSNSSTMLGYRYSDLYNCSQGESYNSTSSIGNISEDPMFVDPQNGDYHLQPGSPCIDAGDPASDYSQEPSPNGGRINMGCYGNTSEATTSQ